MANAQYRNLYSHFLEFYGENVFDLTLWQSRLDSLKSMITPQVSADSYRTRDYGFPWTILIIAILQRYENQHVKRGIKEFVNRRNNSIKEQIVWLDAVQL